MKRTLARLLDLTVAIALLIAIGNAPQLRSVEQPNLSGSDGQRPVAPLVAPQSPAIAPTEFATLPTDAPTTTTTS